jgi:lipopolysaccharide export system protein LptA
MRKLFATLALCLLSLVSAHAQFGSFGDIPIEINAEDTGEVVDNVVTFNRNVVVRYADILLYSDFAQYNLDTRDVLVSGMFACTVTGSSSPVSEQFTTSRRSD